MSNEPQPIVWPGQPYPLGSTWDGEGVNFALYSKHAEKVELCLFDSSGNRETLRVQIHEQKGNHLGPTLSLKGIDNSSYYRLVADNSRYYEDYTGTGNTLNMQHPRVLQLIMDSLRYWVLEMHVDGFRFGLAATLARELHEVDRLGAFLDIIHQGRPIKGASVKDVLWLNPGGIEISEDEWRDPSLHCLGMFLSGEGVDETDERGRELRDENFLVLLNAHHEDVGFTLPAFRAGSRWTAWMDTSREGGLRSLETYDAGTPYPLQARSMVVLLERRGIGKKEEPNEAPL